MTDQDNIKILHDDNRRWYTVDEIVALPESDDIWLVEGLLPRKGLAGLTGSSDTGKSTLARQLGLAVATGQEFFLGRQINAKHNRVVYVSTEDDELGIKRFIGKQLPYFGGACSSMHMTIGSHNVSVELAKFLKLNQVDLIVIDVWADTFQGNSNLMTDIRKNLNEYQEIANRNDCLILFVLHNVKNSENSAPDKNKTNGSQALEAKLRVLLELRKVDDMVRVLTILKGNYLSDKEKKNPIRLKLRDDYMVMEPIGGTGDGALTGDPTTVKYDKELWKSRFDVYKTQDPSRSIASIRKDLVDEYGEEKVPGSTWFKTNTKTEEANDSNEIVHTPPHTDEDVEQPRRDNSPLYFLM